jgi:two-component system, OmpR family, aerobic respiration control sensor histidine kinase ArcB
LVNEDKSETTESLESRQPVTLGRDLPATEGELFQLNQYFLLDEQDAIERAGGRLEMLVEVLKSLVNESIPEEKANIEEAYSKKDWKRIQELAHKMKGGALYCSAKRMGYACRYLERYLLAGHSKLQEQLYQQLIKIQDETRQHVIQYLKELQKDLEI